MAVVNSDFLSGLLTNFRTVFAQDFQAAMAWQAWKDISMRVVSNTETESYNWFGTVPKMEDVTNGDGPSLQGLEKYNFSITNRLYKAGLEVERSTIEDDRMGMIQPRLRQLGPEAARHPGELIFDLFESNGNAYDGTAFFANTRSIGDSGNVDNIVTGSGTSVANVQTDLASARAAMSRFNDDRGRPMNLRINALVIPPELEMVFWQALNFNDGAGLVNTMPPATQDGRWSSAGYTVITNPYLSDTNDWYALALAGEMRPFVFQDRVSPALEGITDPNTESGAIRDRFIYTVRARYNVGYGDPRYAVKVTNA